MQALLGQGRALKQLKRAKFCERSEEDRDILVAKERVVLNINKLEISALLKLFKALSGHELASNEGDILQGFAKSICVGGY